MDELLHFATKGCGGTPMRGALLLRSPIYMPQRKKAKGEEKNGATGVSSCNTETRGS